MTDSSLPIVRLRPKAEARAIRHGFPWVYADELVTDRRTSKLAPGAFAVLEDAERRPLGLVTVNVQSKIIARMMDRDPGAVIDSSDHSSIRLFSIGVPVMAIFSFSESLHLAGGVIYSRLLGDAADSPLVAERGSRDQFFAGIGIGFAW